MLCKIADLGSPTVETELRPKSNEDGTARAKLTHRQVFEAGLFHVSQTNTSYRARKASLDAPGLTAVDVDGHVGLPDLGFEVPEGTVLWQLELRAFGLLVARVNVGETFPVFVAILIHAPFGSHVLAVWCSDVPPQRSFLWHAVPVQHREHFVILLVREGVHKPRPRHVPAVPAAASVPAWFAAVLPDVVVRPDLDRDRFGG